MELIDGSLPPRHAVSLPQAAHASLELHRESTNTIEEAPAAIADEAAEYEAVTLQATTNQRSADYVPGKDMPMAKEEASALKGLTEDVRNQDDIERDITNKANLAMIKQEDERDNKRIEKVNCNQEKLRTIKRAQERRLAITHDLTLRKACLDEIAGTDADLKILESDIKDIQGRIEARHQYDSIQQTDAAGGNMRLPNESQRDFLIRTGKITPFSRVPHRGSDGLNGDLTEALMDAEDEADEQAAEPAEQEEPKSHQNLRLPGFADIEECGSSTIENEFSLRPRKRRRLQPTDSNTNRPSMITSEASDVADSPDAPDAVCEDDRLDAEEEEDSLMTAMTSTKRSYTNKKIHKNLDVTSMDDGNEHMYQARLRRWVDRRSTARTRKLQENTGHHRDISDATDTSHAEVEEEEWFKPCPDAPDHQLENDVKLPGDIYPALFDYQKTGVQWLGQLYAQSVGGIIGDEMGLGKTIQAISFIAGLHYSKRLTKPVIVVAPATVLRQWAKEFYRWWPPLRVSILHSSGSGMLNMGNNSRFGDDGEELICTKGGRSEVLAKKIVDRVVKDGHVLVTTYAGLQTYRDILISIDWEYAILDEGHKIRNPNTDITIACKELRTSNRIILSGTPMQNNLIELWSLFDFVFPMRLGTLVNFRQCFEIPIKLGGYANATNLQILSAEKTAETLKAAISPYLLQRLKVDVASDLPKKSEKVIFCKLTKPQRDAYEVFLASDEMTSIANHTRQPLYGIDILRKICNHPDLLDPQLKGKPGYGWGNPNKSGKMQVVKALLKMWKDHGHKTLLFSQGVQMLNIIENFVKNLKGFRYLRMDGRTDIKDRQNLVDRFNNEPDLHVFLLTTKVGGLGVNLTGANRVIIFDPDWNPSTDIQARERAWRLGQKKEVSIFRLMTAGTIEEKVYHRQIFKQFLTNKILKDPKQRQTFQTRNLYDLFTLGEADEATTETGEMFKGTEVHLASAKPQPLSTSGQGAQAHEAQTDNSTTLFNITGVSSLEPFNAPASDDTPASELDSEHRLMSNIFSRSGVHSALEHDQIINGKKVIHADRYMIDQEARKVAAEAASELRKAGEAARSIAPGRVTWTGEVGEVGRPRNVRRGVGPNSASVLAGLANRQGLDVGGNAGNSRATPSGAGTGGTTPRGKDFMKLIRDFINRLGGSAPTQALVNHFNRLCRTTQQSAEFKHMLGEIARLEEGGDGNGGGGTRMRKRWVLKDDFK